MNKILLALLVPLTVVMSTSTADAQTKLTKNFFVHNSQKFRRAGAESANLGSIGIVRKTFGKAYRYEKKSSGRSILRDQRVRVRKVTRIKGKFFKNSNNGGGVTYAGLGLHGTAEQLRSGKLDVVLFELSSDVAWVKAANDNPQALKELHKIMPQHALRVVRRIWVVVDAKLYNEFEGKVKGGAIIEGLVLKSDNEGHNRASFTISARSIFAYEIAKVKWTQKGKKVDRLKVDRVNM